MDNPQIGTVLCDGNVITYTLTRKKVKNINLRIKPNGEICVSASPTVPKKYIDEFVASKYSFITEYLEKSAEQKKVSVDILEINGEGDSLFYMGSEYKLKINRSAEDNIFLSDGDFVVETIDVENIVYIRKLIRNWYYNRTIELFRRLNSEVYSEFRKLYNVPNAEIHIKTMKSRWGSCKMSEGKISMNSRLIYYPEQSARYVFIHEYAHFIVPNHSKDFYKVVAKFMPDYKKWSDMLK